MGIAVLSGTIASLEPLGPFHSSKDPKWETHTPGTRTPTGLPDLATPSRFIACVGRQASIKRLAGILCNLGSRGEAVEILANSNVEAVKQSDVVILACKPQAASNILMEEGMKAALSNKLLISILAGVTISQLSQWVAPNTIIVRAMPNTPCKIREGMTVVTPILPGPHAELHREIILNIFSSIGRCRFLEEKHFDACTALSGSGPAFACIVIEAMADGGVMMGLPRAEALELACQTLQGTARMALQPGAHPAQIRDAVTTPGGCTIAGLLAMEDGRIRSTIARAIQIATERASELGNPSK